jgi:putative ABC transport system permease protein
VKKHPLDSLDADIRDHLDRETQQNIALGMSPQQARQAAQRKFGSVTLTKEQTRAVWVPIWLEQVMQDVRYGARALLKSPGFAALAVLTVALGIGANTAMFAIANSVLFEPLKYRDPSRLFTIVNLPPPSQPSNRYWPVNARHFHHWRAQCRSCDDVAIAEGIGLTLTGLGEAERLQGLRVSYNFFRTLGVQPRLGRDFRPEEELPGAFHELILSDTAWRSRFGSDAGILGRSIQVNGEPHTIVGVMPPDFRLPVGNQWGPNAGAAVQPLVFRPLGIDVSQAGGAGNLNFLGVARLKAGVMPEHAASELETLIAELVREYRIELTPALLPLQETVIREAVLGVWLLHGIVAVVLLIVCVNVGTLMLARTASRQREVAIRMALGSDRARLFRLALSESIVFVLVGAALGLTAASWALQAVVAWGPVDLPRIGDIHLGSRALLFTTAATTIAMSICGLFPAWRLSRTDPNESLKAGSAKGAAITGRLRSREFMVGMQVALSTVLLVVGGLLTVSLVGVLRVPKGFEQTRLITHDVSLSNSRYDEAGRIRFIDDALARVSALPAVQSAGVTNQLPARGQTWICGLRDAGLPEQREAALANIRFVSPDYWRTLGIPLKKGRLVASGDRNRAVAVLSERAADVLWPGRDPIGKRIGGCGGPSAPRVLEVIGVVGDVRATLEDEAPLTVYQPYWHVVPGRPYFVARTHAHADAALLAGDIRSALRSIDADLPVSQAVTMDQILDEATAARRFHTTLAVAFAGVGLCVAALGIYGVVAYSVAQRRQEIGIRIALGARRTQLMALVMRQSLVVTGLGLLVGLAAAAVVTPSLRTLLFGVSPLNVGTFAGVTLLFGSISALAAYLPARRAANVDPLVSIRAE